MTVYRRLCKPLELETCSELPITAVHNNTVSVGNLVKFTARFDRTDQTREERIEGKSS